MKSIREKVGRWLGKKLQVTPPLEKGDLRWLPDYNRCPDCQGELFIHGPEGGMSMNIRCATCGTKFCFMGPFTPMRIDNEDFLYHGKPGTLEEITGWQGYFCLIQHLEE